MISRRQVVARIWLPLPCRMLAPPSLEWQLRSARNTVWVTIPQIKLATANSELFVCMFGGYRARQKFAPAKDTTRRKDRRQDAGSRTQQAECTKRKPQNTKHKVQSAKY